MSLCISSMSLCANKRKKPKIILIENIKVKQFVSDKCHLLRQLFVAIFKFFVGEKMHSDFVARWPKAIRFGQLRKKNLSGSFVARNQCVATSGPIKGKSRPAKCTGLLSGSRYCLHGSFGKTFRLAYLSLSREGIKKRSIPPRLESFSFFGRPR